MKRSEDRRELIRSASFRHADYRSGSPRLIIDESFTRPHPQHLLTNDDQTRLAGMSFAAHPLLGARHSVYDGPGFNPCLNPAALLSSAYNSRAGFLGYRGAPPYLESNLHPTAHPNGNLDHETQAQLFRRHSINLPSAGVYPVPIVPLRKTRYVDDDDDDDDGDMDKPLDFSMSTKKIATSPSTSSSTGGRDNSNHDQEVEMHSDEASMPSLTSSPQPGYPSRVSRQQTDNEAAISAHSQRPSVITCAPGRHSAQQSAISKSPNCSNCAPNSHHRPSSVGNCCAARIKLSRSLSMESSDHEMRDPISSLNLNLNLNKQHNGDHYNNCNSNHSSSMNTDSNDSKMSDVKSSSQSPSISRNHHPGPSRVEIISSGVCDPVIDEHFRRSLGKNYSQIFAPKSKIKSDDDNDTSKSSGNDKEEEDEDSSVSMTVDDHFAKALGETWTKLQKTSESNRPGRCSSTSSSQQRSASRSRSPTPSTSSSPSDPPSSTKSNANAQIVAS